MTEALEAESNAARGIAPVLGLTPAQKIALFDELFTLLDHVGVLLLDARAKHEAEAARRAKIAAEEQEPWYQDWQTRKKLEDAARFDKLLRDKYDKWPPAAPLSPPGVPPLWWFGSGSPPHRGDVIYCRAIPSSAGGAGHIDERIGG